MICKAFVIPDRKAETIVKMLYQEYFTVFGFPHRLMSDQNDRKTRPKVKAQVGRPYRLDLSCL